MAKRSRTVFIPKECVLDFSQEKLDELNEIYRVVTVSDEPIPNREIKTTTKKPAAFATLRKNSILYTGDTNALRKQLQENECSKLAFDFDGVVSSYVFGWKGLPPECENIDVDCKKRINDFPSIGIIPLMLELLDSGKEIVIYSSRCSTEDGIVAMDEYLQFYGMFLNKDQFVTEIDETFLLIDDRVIDYTQLDVDLVEFLSTFSSWVPSDTQIGLLRPYNEWEVPLYEIVFTPENNDEITYCFECSPIGELRIDTCDVARENYRKLISGEISGYTTKGIQKRYIPCYEPIIFRCDCGKMLYLEKYRSSNPCSCGKCYNLFGQELELDN